MIFKTLRPRSHTSSTQIETTATLVVRKWNEKQLNFKTQRPRSHTSTTQI